MATVDTTEADPKNSGGVDRPIYDYLAPLLALWLPAFVFLFHHGYPIYRPEALLFLGFSTGVALVCTAIMRRSSPLARSIIIALLVLVFVDIQFNVIDRHFLFAVLIAAVLVAGGWFFQRRWLLLVVIVLSTMSAATVVLIALSLYFYPKPVEAAPRDDHSDLPLFVHLILDEHIGIAGLPDTESAEEVRGRLRSHYVGNGFRLYGGAFSEYFHTRISLSHLFSFQSEFNPDAAREYERRVADENASFNTYFRTVAEWGYDLRITQLRYMRFCSDRTTLAATCRTYNGNLSALVGTDLPILERTRILFAFYLSLSRFGDWTREAYGFVRRPLQRTGLSLPDWPAGATEHVTPIAALDELNGLIRRLETAERGEFHFAHILLPHYPYVFDEACRIRPYEYWLLRRAVGLQDRATNTPASRALRYRRYLAQIGCVTQKIDELIDVLRRRGLYKDAIILIHGDHGSRIGFADPTSGYYKQADAQEFRDHYTTLFAIKAPAIPPGYDPRLISMHALFRELVQGRFNGVPSIDTDEVVAASAASLLPTGAHP